MNHQPTDHLSLEELPDVEALVIEDDQPVESIFAEKQYRLLTEPLYSSWSGPGEGRSFLALANVGLFYAAKQPPLAPDVMLSLDVPASADLGNKENLSYFTWIKGKPPEVVIEFVSDRRGGEGGYKKNEYARIGVCYYAIFDPKQKLSNQVLRSYALRERRWEELAHPWFEAVGLGLTLWEGAYEEQQARWLRWCDAQGNLIPTGHERLQQEHERAEQERQRADAAEAELARVRALLAQQRGEANNEESGNP
jgi:Uma2 family endonuclease